MIDDNDATRMSGWNRWMHAGPILDCCAVGLCARYFVNIQAVAVERLLSVFVILLDVQYMSMSYIQTFTVQVQSKAERSNARE